MKNSNDTIGNRTRDLLACSAVPQPTAQPRAPIICKYTQYVNLRQVAFRATELPNTRRDTSKGFNLGAAARREFLSQEHLQHTYSPFFPVLKLRSSVQNLPPTRLACLRKCRPFRLPEKQNQTADDREVTQ